MTDPVVVVLVMCVPLAAAAVALLVMVRARAADTDWLIRDRERTKVVVTMRGGATFQGVLYETDDRSLILRDATALRTEDGQVPVDGEILLARADVEYLQRP